MNWLRSQVPTFEFLFDGWRNHLTVSGKTLTCVMVACVPALATLDSPLFLLFSTLLSLLLLTGVTGYWFRPRLAVRVVAPTAGVQGKPVEFMIRLANEAAQVAHDLSVELVGLPATWKTAGVRQQIGQLAGGESIGVSLAVCPLRRGLFDIPDVRITSTFPLNLFRFHRTYRTHTELVVVPHYLPLAGLDTSRTAAQHVGEQQTKVSALGHGGDYFSSREYVPGMPVRRWDHSSSARLGQLVVREFTNAQHPTAAIVADTCFRQATRTVDERIPELEATLSLSAALSEALTAQHYRIVMLAAGDVVQDLSSYGLADQHKALMSFLAVVDPAGTDDFSPASLDNLGTVPSVVFVLLSRWDRDCEALCDKILRSGGRLKRIFLNVRAAAQAHSRPPDSVVSVADIDAGLVEIALAGE